MTVHDVVARHQLGDSVAVIAEGFGLTVRDIQAALAYYEEHRDQIDRELVEDNAEIRGRAAAQKDVTERLRRALRERGVRASHE